MTCFSNFLYYLHKSLLCSLALVCLPVTPFVLMACEIYRSRSFHRRVARQIQDIESLEILDLYSLNEEAAEDNPLRYSTTPPRAPPPSPTKRRVRFEGVPSYEAEEASNILTYNAAHERHSFMWCEAEAPVRRLPKMVKNISCYI